MRSEKEAEQQRQSRRRRLGTAWPLQRDALWGGEHRLSSIDQLARLFHQTEMRIVTLMLRSSHRPFRSPVPVPPGH